MGGCDSCKGGCDTCSGCAKELVLTPGEIFILEELAQIPFLPVARRADDMDPVFLEYSDREPEEYSLILACLEKKGLVDMDYHSPLSGFDYSAYRAYPLHGSIALTARGQSVLELLDRQGITLGQDF